MALKVFNGGEPVGILTSARPKVNEAESNEVILKVTDVHEKIVGGVKTLIATVPTSSFLDTNIPNKANSREFTGEKNPAVKAMKRTLLLEPEMFYSKNLGIRMVAKQVKNNFAHDRTVTMIFDEDEGIFNGGHTYNVLRKHGVSTAYVEVVIQTALPKPKLVEISLALNMSKKLERTSQNEKVGAFEWIKAKLPEEPIIYKEGGQGQWDVTSVLKAANLFKKGRGNAFGENNLLYSQKNIKDLLDDNMNKNQPLKITEYILPEIWELYKRIWVDPVIISNLPEKFSKRGKLNSQDMVLVVLLGATYLAKISNAGCPVWADRDMTTDKVMVFFHKVTKEIGKSLNRVEFRNVESVQKDPYFHERVKNIYLEALRKK